MSASLPALQEQAQAAADAFCRRYIQPPRRKTRSKSGSTRSRHGNPSAPRTSSSSGKFYRPRDHEASPFFKIVSEHFDEFERIYPGKYQELYGYWRPVIRSSIDKFLTTQRSVVAAKPTAVISKKASPASVVPTAKKSFSSLSHVVSVRVALPATRH